MFLILCCILHLYCYHKAKKKQKDGEKTCLIVIKNNVMMKKPHNGAKTGFIF